jgi:hypothetical protein
MIGVSIMLLALASLIFAAKIGAWPERVGAATIFLASVATQLIQLSVGREPPLWIMGFIDFAQCLVFLGLTLKAKRVWAGFAGCAQLLVVVFTVVRYFEFPLAGTPYLIVLNVCGWVPILALVGGAIAHRWGKPQDEYGGDPVLAR